MRSGVVGSGNVGSTLAESFIRVAVALPFGRYRELPPEPRARRRGAPDRIALPLSGDYPEGKTVVARLNDQVGFDSVDRGGPVDGGRLYQQSGPLYVRPLTAAEILRTLGVRGFGQPHAG